MVTKKRDDVPVTFERLAADSEGDDATGRIRRVLDDLDKKTTRSLDDLHDKVRNAREKLKRVK